MCSIACASTVTFLLLIFGSRCRPFAKRRRPSISFLPRRGSFFTTTLRGSLISFLCRRIRRSSSSLAWLFRRRRLLLRLSARPRIPFIRFRGRPPNKNASFRCAFGAGVTRPFFLRRQTERWPGVSPAPCLLFLLVGLRTYVSLAFPFCSVFAAQRCGGVPSARSRACARIARAREFELRLSPPLGGVLGFRVCPQTHGRGPHGPQAGGACGQDPSFLLSVFVAGRRSRVTPGWGIPFLAPLGGASAGGCTVVSLDTTVRTDTVSPMCQTFFTSYPQADSFWPPRPAPLAGRGGGDLRTRASVSRCQRITCGYLQFFGYAFFGGFA